MLKFKEDSMDPKFLRLDEKGDKADFDSLSSKGESLTEKRKQEENRGDRKSLTSYSQTTDTSFSNKSPIFYFTNKSPNFFWKSPSQTQLGITHKESFVDHLYQRAETMFRNGDWKQAALLYSRGVNLRPNMNIFKNGLRKTYAAIAESRGKKSIFQWKYARGVLQENKQLNFKESVTQIVKVPSGETEDKAENEIPPEGKWEKDSAFYAYEKSLSENKKKTEQEEGEKVEEYLKQKDKEVMELLKLLEDFSTDSENVAYSALRLLNNTGCRNLPN
ncbi:hypothetical protein L9F63_017906, partial [Diploptera punctata]